MSQPYRAQVLHGPHRIARNGQIVIPKEVLRAARLSPGDAVYLTESEEGEGALLLVPAGLALRWFEIGRRVADEAPGSDTGAP